MYVFIGIVFNDLLDYFLIYVFFYDEVLLYKSEKKFFKCLFKEDNLNKFNEFFVFIDWLKFFNMDDFNEFYNRFINEYLK